MYKTIQVIAQPYVYNEIKSLTYLFHTSIIQVSQVKYSLYIYIYPPYFTKKKSQLKFNAEIFSWTTKLNYYTIEIEEKDAKKKTRMECYGR